MPIHPESCRHFHVDKADRDAADILDTICGYPCGHAFAMPRALLTRITFYLRWHDVYTLDAWREMCHNSLVDEVLK